MRFRRAAARPVHLHSYPLAAVSFAAAAILAAPPAAAQPVEAVGVRALGMAGAFVAVADDVSAVHWNPAGLAKGPLAGAVIERVSGDLDPAGRDAGVDASSRRTSFFAVGVPSLGLSYSQTRLVRAPVADMPDASSRNDSRPEAIAASSLTLHNTGVTVLQSLGDRLVVGSTLRWVHGVAAVASVAPGTSPDARLEEARALSGRSTNAFDLDVGVLAVFGRVRAGLVARNLRQPGFEAFDGTRLGLERQVRAGFALDPGQAVTVAVDADLVETTDVDGERRQRAAAGVEVRPGTRFTLRGGVNVALVGPSRTLGSVGASLALTRTLWLDGQVTHGGSGDSSWGVAARYHY